MNEARSPSREVFSDRDYESGYPDGVERNFWWVARNRIVGDVVRRLAPGDGMILDIGCGRGFTVSHLRAAGFECHGVEMGAPRIASDLREFVRTSQDAMLLPKTFRDRVRLVLLLDVLEHMDDPAGFLAGCRSAFPNCRHVVVTVPARAELWSNFDAAYGHRRRYDHEGIEALFDRAGVRTVMVSYFFHLLYVALFLQSRFGMDRSVEVRPPSALLLQSGLGRFFWLERKILPRKLPGSSILAVGVFS